MRGCNGTPVTVGPGIIGYQAYSTNDTCDGTEPPYVRVFWKTQGVCFELTATTVYSGPEDFNTRYGAIWQYMLASFVPPSPPPSGGTTCS